MSQIAAVILAGGQGTRMDGCDKGLMLFGQKPMVSWVLDSVEAEVDKVIVSCNRNIGTYRSLGIAVVSDRDNSYKGPLAGIQAAIDSVDFGYSHLLVLPCDTPLLGTHLIQQLLTEAQYTPDHIVYLKTGEQCHYLHAVIPLRYRESLDEYLAADNRAVWLWYKQFPNRAVSVLENEARLLNVNSPKHLTSIITVVDNDRAAKR